MKMILGVTFLAAAVAGCAHYQTTAAPQNYRFAGNDKPVEITGFADSKEKFDGMETNVTISFDGQPMIAGKLDRGYNGELKGQDYNGKPTSASCTGRQSGYYNVEVRCMVFVGNERTVTLTF